MLKKAVAYRLQLLTQLRFIKTPNYNGTSTSLSYSVADLGNIGFHDNIRPVKVLGTQLPFSTEVILYEHTNFGGKRIIIQPGGYDVNLSCLCDFKIGSSGPYTIYIVGGGGVTSGAICGWFCDSWNDEVSSIGIAF